MKKILCIIGLLAAISCGGSSDNNSEDSINSITLSFTRIPGAGLDSFTVTASIIIDSVPVTGVTPDVTVDKGVLSTITELGSGRYQFTVTPSKTGEHTVTVTYGTATVTRTALVLQDVHPDWGQPMSVPGYVNTAGYEDGVTITPNGEYLFVQTGPYRFSSLFVFNEPRVNGGCGGNRLLPDKCSHPWINETFGTYTSPERPGFYNGRFSGTTQLHNAISWGVGIDESPFYAITTLFYGFKRQSDGSFKEPFFMAFNDLNDGITSPFGLSFRKNSDGTHTIIFSLKDLLTTGNGFDVYTTTEDFGNNINLGDYVATTPGNPPTRGAHFPSTLVDFGDNSGTQGNPFLYYLSDGTINSIWTDDEFDGDGDTRKLSVYVLASGEFPSTGTWSKILLPSNVNQVGKEAVQPTFSGNGLYYTEDTNVVFAAYSGTATAADYGNNSNWIPPIVLLQKDTSIGGIKPPASDIGKVIAIGEPTIATVNGKTELYFVYGYIRGIDPITGIADIDMQAGYVERN